MVFCHLLLDSGILSPKIQWQTTGKKSIRIFSQTRKSVPKQHGNVCSRRFRTQTGRPFAIIGSLLIQGVSTMWHRGRKSRRIGTMLLAWFLSQIISIMQMTRSVENWRMNRRFNISYWQKIKECYGSFRETGLYHQGNPTHRLVNPWQYNPGERTINHILEKGEEVFISYGSHPNDFLFIECQSQVWGIGWPNTNFKADGFFLDHNPSDAVFLDDIIFQDLTAAEQEDLKRHDLYG